MWVLYHQDELGLSVIFRKLENYFCQSVDSKCPLFHVKCRGEGKGG